MPDVASLDSADILNLLDAIAVKSQKITEAIKGTGETSTKHMKTAGESVAGLDKSVSSLSKNLLGPVGLAAGFVAVGKSLENFAVGQLQLQNLARNTGFATSAVLQMQAQFQRAGLSIGEANQAVSSFGAAFQNITMLREGSPVFQKIAEGSPKLAAGLLSAKDATERMALVSQSYERARERGNVRWMLQLEEIFHTNETGMDALNDRLQGHIKLLDVPPGKLKEYNAAWIGVQNAATNVWGIIAHSLTEKLLEMSGGLEGFEAKVNETTLKSKTYWESNIGPVLTRELETLGKLKEFYEWMSKQTEGRQGPLGLGKLTEKEFLKRQGDEVANRYGTEDFDIKYEMQSSSGSKIIDFSRWLDQKLGTGKRSSLEEGGGAVELSARTHTEEDSNKQLHGIYDILARQEIKLLTGGGGSGGGGGTPGGGGSGPIFRPNVGGMGGTRGNRNNNRGNIKFGEFAKGMGATGQDERGFAIFPTEAAGDAAHAALLKQPQYQNLTLDQFGNKYSEGSAAWKDTVGKALGIGRGDIVNTSDPRLLEGIRRAEGTSTSGRMDPMAPSGSRLLGADSVATVTSPSGRQFRVAKEFAPNFQGFINDYENAGGVIGPNSGGLAGRGNPSYHPLGRAIDVNQTGYGQRGGGKTLPEDVENALAQKWGLYPGSKFKSRSDIGHFEVRNAEIAAEARARLDKSMQGAAPNGHLSADITFGNVPPGVKTNTEGKGFKTLRVTSSKQNQQSTEGLLGPGDLQYTPFVP